MDLISSISTSVGILYGNVPQSQRAADAALTALIERAAAGDAAVISAARSLLADASTQDSCRHFCLQCLQAGIGHMSRLANSPAALSPLHAVCLDLIASGSRGPVSEASFVKAKISDAVGSAMTRLWPQRWPDCLPSMLAAASSSLAACELAACTLSSVAAIAGSSDLAGRVPPSRRSELVAGLTATFDEWGRHFTGVLDTCVGVIRSGAPSGALTPAAACILSCEVLRLFASTLLFLPCSAIRAVGAGRQVFHVWQAVSSSHKARPGALSPILLVRVYTSCVSVVQALCSRRWDSPVDADVCSDAIAAAVAVASATASSDSTAQAARHGGGEELGAAQGQNNAESRSTSLAPLSLAGLDPSSSLRLDSSACLAFCDGFAGQWMSVLAGAVKQASVAGGRIASAGTLSQEPALLLHQALSLLLCLLQHASPHVRSAAAGTLASVLQAQTWPKDGGGQVANLLAQFYASAVSPLIACLLREPRFLLSSLLLPGRPPVQCAVDSLHSSPLAQAQLAVSRHDIEDDDEEEATYVMDTMRGRACKALTALARVCPIAASEGVRSSTRHTVALCMLRGPDPPGSGTYYGGQAAASSASRHVDALSHAFLSVCEGLPQPSPSLLVGVNDPLYEAASAVICCLRDCTDPWLRSGLASCVAHMHGALARLQPSASCPSLLPSLLEVLFAGIEYAPPASLLHAADSIADVTGKHVGGRGGNRNSRGGGGSRQASPMPTPTERRTFFANQCQFARQRCCSALVALSRKVPALLLPALAPMADRAARLLSTQAQYEGAGLGQSLGLSSADRVSLYEVLLLVSNAMAGQDAAAHATFVNSVCTAPVQAWAALAPALASPAALLQYLGMAHSPSAAPADFILVKGKCEELFAALHLVWAISRRCTAAEMLHAVTGSYGVGLDRGDRLDLPQHPFAAHWLSVLPNAIALATSLAAFWRSDVVQALASIHLVVPSAGSFPAISAARPVLCAAHMLALSPDEQRVLQHAGRGDFAPKQAEGTATGSDVGGEGDGNGDSDEDGEGGGNGPIGEGGGDGSSSARGYMPLHVFVPNGRGGLVVKSQRVHADTHAAAAWLCTWYSRVTWHAYALIAWAAEAHVPARKHSCAVVSIRGSPSLESTFSDACIPSGLFHVLGQGSVGPALQALLHPDALVPLPTRLLKHMLLQLCPGLVVGCPPAAATGLGSLLSSLVQEVTTRVTRAGSGAKPDPAFNANVGLLLSPPGRTNSRAGSDMLSEYIIQESVRACLDVGLALFPPTEVWYSAIQGQNIGGACGCTASSPSSSPPTMAIPGLGPGTVVNVEPSCPTEPGMHQKVDADAAGRPQSLIITVAPLIAWDTVLANPACACAWAGVLRSAASLQDTVAARKVCTLLQRLLPALSALALSATRQVGSPYPAIIETWASSLVDTFSRMLEDLLRGAAYTVAIENDMVAVAADVYTRCELGVGLDHAGPIASITSSASDPHLAAGMRLVLGAPSGSEPSRVPRQGGEIHSTQLTVVGAIFTHPPVPLDPHGRCRHVLMQAIAACPAHPGPEGSAAQATRFAEWELRVLHATSERDRRTAFRELLQDMASSTETGGAGTVMRPRHTGQSSCSRGGSVLDLPERLTFLGREGGGLGSSSHARSDLLDEPSGLERLFSGQ